MHQRVVDRVSQKKGRPMPRLALWLVTYEKKWRLQLAKLAGINADALIQISKGQRRATARHASLVHEASVLLSEMNGGATPVLLKSDICIDCQDCQYARACVPDIPDVSRSFDEKSEKIQALRA